MPDRCPDGADLPRYPKDAPCEDIDEALNEIDELCERWADRFTVKNLAFAKRYIENKLELVLILVCDAGGGLPLKKYCAVFQRKLSVIRDKRHGHRGEMPFFPRVFHGDGPVDLGESAADRDQQPVFIDDIETVETPEGIVPSLVRLEPMDEFKCVGGNALEHGRNVVGKVFGRPTYWELCPIVLHSTIMNNEVVSEKIEGGSKVVNNIADGPAPPGWDVFHYFKLVDFISRLRIAINDDEIRFSILEGSHLAVKLVKMLLGPVDLYSDSEKRIMAHVWHP